MVSSLQVPHVGLDAARTSTKANLKEIQFEPKETSLSEPKEGIDDGLEHHGGNTFAGGVSMCLLMPIPY